MSDRETYYMHERPELVALVDQDAARVLDLGCGEGGMSAAIRRDRGAREIWGVEIVEEVAAKAKLNPALDRVLCGDLEELVDSLPDNHFSHIIAGDVLEHLVEPWRVLGKLKPKLATDGKFICSIPNIRNFSFLAKLFIKGRFEYKDSGVMDRTHLRFFARKDVQLLFSGAGFSNITIGPVRPKKSLAKTISRMIFGDLVIKGFLVVAN